MIRNIVLAGCTVLLAACGGSDNAAPPDRPPVITPPPGIELSRVFENLSFSQPVALLQSPAVGARWFVVEKGGVIRAFNNDQNAVTSSIFLDLRPIVDAAGEGGLLGMAFDPDFPLVPQVYVSFTRTGSPLVSYISRFTSDDLGLTLDPLTEEVILTVAQPENNHNGGDIRFGPDGFLYAAFGDGGGAGDPDGNGQNTNTLMGAILRLDVRGGSPYGIPAGNPFEANPTCAGGSGQLPCPEIYAWGLRNPWRMSFDRNTGKLWLGDVGQGAWEEINVIEAGDNYGWNIREGAHCFNPPTDCASSFTEPVSEYGRDLGRSVTGGYVYRGTAIPTSRDWYLFGDFGSGRIFAIPEDSVSVTAPSVLYESGLQIVSFAETSTGELYVLHFGGTIHQITGAP